jgi:uncharacterized protein YuzE
MKISYDQASDAATIYIVDEIGHAGAPRSVMCDLEVRDGAVILMLSDDDRLVGIEVLGASRVLPVEVLRAAQEPPTQT